MSLPEDVEGELEVLLFGSPCSVDSEDVATFLESGSWTSESSQNFLFRLVRGFRRSKLASRLAEDEGPPLGTSTGLGRILRTGCLLGTFLLICHPQVYPCQCTLQGSGSWVLSPLIFWLVLSSPER